MMKVMKWGRASLSQHMAYHYKYDYVYSQPLLLVSNLKSTLIIVLVAAEDDVGG
jgi:hypothetical protein